jgi:multidrug efflux pump subunit AcrB
VKLTFFDNTHLLFVSIAGILVAGVSAFFAIPRLEDPRITNRNPIVLTPVPGASAERVEALVTEPLEEALQEIAEIKETNSTSRAGISVISIALEDEIEAGENERVFSKIRDQLADAERLLPPDALSPEVDDERDPVAFTLLVALQWDAEGEPRLGLMTRLAEELADRLRNIDGTELVRLYAEVDEEITVSIDRDEVSALGLTVADVARALQRADAKRSAGTLRTGALDVQLEVEGGFSAVDRLRRIPLQDGDGLAIAQLGDVADIARGWDDPPLEIGRSDGRRSVYVAARMNSDTKVGGWSEQALGIVEDARRTFGPGVELSVVFDQSAYTIERLRELAFNLLLGVGVVMVVIFLTMGFRSALVVGSAIPLVAAATLFGVLLSGGQLHQMSIFGMIIALGLLIDNAIVVVDETRKRM